MNGTRKIEGRMVNSREKILSAIAQNQPETTVLPADPSFGVGKEILVDVYTRMATGVASKVIRINSLDDIRTYIKENFRSDQRIVCLLPELADVAEPVDFSEADPHTFENIDFALLKPHFAVAENGAVWITEELMGHRAIPFICQHLAVLVQINSILPTMHQAYDQIAEAEYGFATFIAGPSKTADIEQSLVLGAHGPRSMTIFLI